MSKAANQISYPSQFELTLRDGTLSTFREISPEDKPRLQEGIHQLSDESIYKRFFVPKRRLSPQDLKYLTEVDQHNHVAWGCLSPDYPHLPGLGLGRFIRFKDDPDNAEFAITVMDEIQQKGLGTYLMALLMVLAEKHEIKQLTGFVLSSNSGFLKMLRQIGEVTHMGGDMNKVILNADPNAVNSLNDEGYASFFKEAMRLIQKKMGE